MSGFNLWCVTWLIVNRPLILIKLEQTAYHSHRLPVAVHQWCGCQLDSWMLSVVVTSLCICFCVTVWVLICVFEGVHEKRIKIFPFRCPTCDEKGAVKKMNVLILFTYIQYLHPEEVCCAQQEHQLSQHVIISSFQHGEANLLLASAVMVLLQVYSGGVFGEFSVLCVRLQTGHLKKDKNVCHREKI